MEVKVVGILGAGQMGNGTAHVAALAGYKTIFYNHRMSTLEEKAMPRITKNLMKAVELGKISEEQKENALKNLILTDKLKDLKEADVIIESLPEQLELKQATFAELDKICPEHTIFASNTTSLSITELASVTDRTDKFIGMHFFNPVHIMRLVEMVNGLETSQETTDTVKALGESFGKTVITVKESPGFVTSRIQAVIGNEAFLMLQEGLATAEDIDTACKLGLNHPMGPFEMVDFVGLDTRLKSLQYLEKMLGEKYKPAPLHVKYVQAGRYGKKVGKGVYDYDENGKKVIK